MNERTVASHLISRYTYIFRPPNHNHGYNSLSTKGVYSFSLYLQQDKINENEGHFYYSIISIVVYYDL